MMKRKGSSGQTGGTLRIRPPHSKTLAQLTFNHTGVLFGNLDLLAFTRDDHATGAKIVPHMILLVLLAPHPRVLALDLDVTQG
jgi:hypothetical protein